VLGQRIEAVDALTAIGEIYSAENPGVTFSFNFDSSGTLKTQIQEGADCDLFISAGQKQMNQLDSTASADVNTEGLDFVDSDSRVDLLENKVVLCVPENADKGIDSCAGCDNFDNPNDCKKFNNIFAKFFELVFRSDRVACIRQIRSQGLEGHARTMAENNRQTIKKS
jgi:hypothetical protein